MSDVEIREDEEEEEGQEMDVQVLEEEEGDSPEEVVVSDDRQEEQPPPPLPSNDNETADETDGSTCMICYDLFTNSGEHRISCLKCGHVFGKDCIFKWLGIHGRCPQCNCKASKRDIRILYVKSLSAVDNTEVTTAKAELKSAEDTCLRYQVEVAKLNNQLQTQGQKMRMLEEQVEQYKLFMRRQASIPSTSAASEAAVLEPQQHQKSPRKNHTGRKFLNISMAKVFDVKEGGCRVGAFDEWLNMLVVSHDVKNLLYPQGRGCIQKFNMLDLRPSSSLPIHSKQIRDMQFSPGQPNMLLTVSMDKKACLFNVSDNITVQGFNFDCPIWSCVWDGVRHNIFYAGLSNGKIIAYDIRVPVSPLFEKSGPSQDSSPVCRMRYIPPTYSNNRNTSFNGAGLLVQRLNSMWLCEDPSAEEGRYSLLPFEGRFVNVDFEPVSRHVLISQRPSLAAQNQVATHRVCELTQSYSESIQRNVISTNVVHTYQGGLEQKMCRSSIFSPEEGYLYVCANGSVNTVKLWDVSLPDGGKRVLSPNFPLMMDCVRGTVNNTQFLGLIGEKKVSIFRSVLE